MNVLKLNFENSPIIIFLESNWIPKIKCKKFAVHLSIGEGLNSYQQNECKGNVPHPHSNQDHKNLDKIFHFLFWLLNISTKDSTKGHKSMPPKSPSCSHFKWQHGSGISYGKYRIYFLQQLAISTIKRKLERNPQVKFSTSNVCFVTKFPSRNPSGLNRHLIT